jgi:hypothetical protein
MSKAAAATPALTATGKPDRAMINMTRKQTAGLDSLNKGANCKYRGGFDYVINSMFIFAVIGMCVKIFFGSATSSDGLYGPANTIIYGYGVVALAVLTVMFVSFAIHDRIGRIENKGKVESILRFLKSFFSSSAPSILTILLLFWIITLNITYFKRINMGMVAKEYYQLSAGTSFLFVFQIICLFQYLKLYIKNKVNGTGCADDVLAQGRIAFATYFILVINLIVIGMMNIILQFFSTDG